MKYLTGTCDTLVIVDAYFYGSFTNKSHEHTHIHIVFKLHKLQSMITQWVLIIQE